MNNALIKELVRQCVEYEKRWFRYHPSIDIEEIIEIQFELLKERQRACKYTDEDVYKFMENQVLEYKLKLNRRYETFYDNATE